MTATATPAVAVDAAVSARGVRVALQVAPGSVTAVVGPNGAGKSTLLQLIGGQLRPDAGTVRLAGVVASSPGVHVPSHRRRVAVLEQRPALFDHLSVLDNVAFGPRAHGVRRDRARERAHAELDAVGCADLAGARAWEVSGGQAQRIALARALATDPDVVLFDEPLAALDASVAPSVRSLLRARLRTGERAALLVTHDPIDALGLADTLAVLEDGRVVDTGPVAERLHQPRTPFLADLVGVNLLLGWLESPDTMTLPGGARVVGVSRAGGTPGSSGFASFRPEAVAVHTSEPGGSPRNHLRARITTALPRGTLVRLGCILADGTPVSADVTAGAALAEDLQPGRDAWLVVKAAQVDLYPR